MLALDLFNNVQVAVKQVIFKDDIEHNECLESAKRVQQLNSPYTVKLLKTLDNPEKKSFFFVNEYISGENLTSYKAKPSFALSTAD